jgi:copper chaperone
MAEANIRIEGMSCEHCVAAVRKGLEAVPGVKSLDVRIGSARVGYDPAVAAPERFEQVLVDLGFDLATA